MPILTESKKKSDDERKRGGGGGETLESKISHQVVDTL